MYINVYFITKTNIIKQCFYCCEMFWIEQNKSKWILWYIFIVQHMMEKIRIFIVKIYCNVFLLLLLRIQLYSKNIRILFISLENVTMTIQIDALTIECFNYFQLLTVPTKVTHYHYIHGVHSQSRNLEISRSSYIRWTIGTRWHRQILLDNSRN